MSEVKRYHLSGGPLVEGEALGRLNVVLAADFDRVQAENRALQERLTVQDQREDDLKALVPGAELALRALNVAVSVYDVELADNARLQLRKLIAALNPTAEEASHEE